MWQAAVIGDALDVATGRTGRVHSVFDHAVNLLIDADLWTITADVHRLSPFSIALTSWPAAGLGVRAGDIAQVRAGFVGLGAGVVDCRAAQRWSGRRWAGAAGGLEQRLAIAETAARPRAWAGTGLLVARFLDSLRRGEALHGALAQMVGRGPGLTPSGDDALVGILAALHLSPDDTDGSGVARRLASALASHLGGTTDISRHLLLQAARGQITRTLHDLGHRLHAPRSAHDLQNALNAALDVGATSGADACLGLVSTLQDRMTRVERFAA
jgi:hypothetical protein